MQPPYAPNVVNQTVEFGGKVWKGNPGSGWTERTFSVDELQRQQISAAMGAIQPAVQSMEAGLPEVANRFDTARGQAEAARNPLLERYENLISDLQGSTQGMIAETQRVWNQEAAKRGLTGSSTFTQEEGLRRTQPIQQAGDAGIRDISLDRENKIRDLDDLIANLTLEQVAAERDIRNTIANLQATASTGALDRALQQFQIEEQSRQANLNRILQERELAIKETAANNPTNTVMEANGRKYLLTYDSQGRIISQQDIGASGSGTGTGTLDLKSIFGADGKVLPTTANINSGAYRVTAAPSVDPSLLGGFSTPLTSQGISGIFSSQGAGNINPNVSKSSSVNYNVPGLGKVSSSASSLSGFKY